MMAATQTIFTGSIGGLVLAGFLSAVLPQPKPIVVHSLTFKDGMMHQDRTVTVEDGEVFFARWEAKVVDAYSGDLIPGCKGGGVWNYTKGHKVYVDTLENWVGSEACTYESLEPGAYKGVAAWYWGTDQTSQTSEPIVKE